MSIDLTNVEDLDGLKGAADVLCHSKDSKLPLAFRMAMLDLSIAVSKAEIVLRTEQIVLLSQQTRQTEQ